MTKKEGIFYAKILLFGEYSIMCGFMALTVPYTHFRGELSFISEDKYTDQTFAGESNKSLAGFLNYLKNLKNDVGLLTDIDLPVLEQDVENGLYFESTIPQGFGIGSSGALCAAIYDRYAINKIEGNKNLSSSEFKKIKKIFSQLESFFHGVSSGLDPLNSCIKKPLLIKPNSSIETVGIPKDFSQNGGIFLINTGKPGKTGPLVSLFFDRYKEEWFMNLVKNEMIPASSIEVWQKGLDTGSYYLKLCGSGGGGFLLGFTKDFEKARELLRQHDVEIIPVS